MPHTISYYLEGWATFDQARKRRFILGRRWTDGPSVLFVMFNPSDADEKKNDPTIECCLCFAKQFRVDGVRVGGLEVVNLFSLCSPNPEALMHNQWREPDDTNNRAITEAVSQADMIIAGWGTNGHSDYAQQRMQQVYRILRDTGDCPVQALRANGDGSPTHPLSLCRIPPDPWQPPQI